MKPKYVEERYPQWFVFGKSSPALADISNGTEDVAVNVEQPEADSLINEHNAAIEMLTTLAQALNKENPERFKKIWYGDGS